MTKTEQTNCAFETQVQRGEQQAAGVTRRLIDVHSVAEKTGFSWRTVLRYADGGLMPWGLKIGSLRRWDLDVIDQWIQDGCRPVRQTGR